jgi:hypothetical protein
VVSIREGDAVTALPATWRPGEWLHIELRWADTVDLWVGEGDAVTASGLDAAQVSAAGIDRVRVSVPPTGALWVDELRVAGPE